MYGLTIVITILVIYIVKQKIDNYGITDEEIRQMSYKEAYDRGLYRKKEELDNQAIHEVCQRNMRILEEMIRKK